MIKRTLSDLALHTGKRFVKAAEFSCYLSVALMDEQTLWDRMASGWTGFDQLFSHSHVFSGLFEWEKKAYFDYLETGDHVLVIGCGAGRDLIGLGLAGYAVTGVDRCETAVDYARKYLKLVGLDVKVHCRDIFDYTMKAASLDAAVFSWYTYGYIPGRKRRVEILVALRSALRNGGKVFLTYNRSRGGHPQRHRFFGIPNRLSHFFGNGHRLEPGDVFSLGGRYAHHFTREEVVEEATLAGYRVIHIADGREGMAVLEKV